MYGEAVEKWRLGMKDVRKFVLHYRRLLLHRSPHTALRLS
jgi:hypothetical protein